MVFPTHVGVFLVEIESEDTPQGLPHARGGVSRGKPEPDPHPASSPRTWGCFSWWRNDTVSAAVFPTHVGVFLDRMTRPVRGPCLPHARGGVSPDGAGRLCMVGSSPRTWGCFTLGAGLSGFGIVFPTHVGGAPSRGCPRKPLPHSWGFSRLPLT